MTIHNLAGKRVCILGFGKEGHATLAAIQRYAPTAEITIADQNPAVVDHAIRCAWQVGDEWLRALDAFDVLIKSPGIPSLSQLTAHSAQLTSSVQIFLDSIADSGATVIGVTGSKGKSTTASLLAAILRAAGRDVHLVGNIGEPSIAHIGDAHRETIFVHELSSYMLEQLTTSPQIAVITSFFPDHLDHHGSEVAYLEAKTRIAQFQHEGDSVYFAAHSPGAATIASHGAGRKVPVEAEDCPIDLGETRLIGEHNRSNVALAWRVVQDLGVSRDTAVQAIRTFEPLPHRLQSLGMIDGIEWVDDAISTTPESAIAALDALDERVRTIILGGMDRGYDFEPLALRLRDSHVQAAILFPGSGPRIRLALKRHAPGLTLIDVETMDDAVREARACTPQQTPPGIVLLSPASPSYGMYKNFEEKGDVFRTIVTSTKI